MSGRQRPDGEGNEGPLEEAKRTIELLISKRHRSIKAMVQN